MRLLTFLGIGRYDLTEYVWGDRSYQTRFAPAAVCRFLDVAEIAVFATEEAEQAHRQALSEAVGDVSICFVPIPTGQTTAELWQIFTTITQAVAPGEQVAFDVTHGLRSLPLVGLLAAAFLQSARHIELEAVLYGAYHVRDKSVDPPRTPVFDLTPMLSLLRWAYAADRFERFGDARDLGALLLEIKDRSVRQAIGDRNVIEAVSGLNSTAGTLNGASLALRLIRVNEALQTAACIPVALERARPAFEAAAAIHPFELLADDIGRAMAPLAFEAPDDPSRLNETLDAQRRVIAWYLDKQQLVQAVTLAREWLVSWAMAYLGQSNLLDQELRNTVSNTLNSEAHRWRESTEKGSFRSVWFADAPRFVEALKLWNALVEVRNDIDHAGMRRGAQSAKVLAERVVDLCKQLQELPLPG